MEKVQINLNLLLPEIPDDRDACVQRIIALLKGKEGVGEVHLINEKKKDEAQLCFHYDPAIISLDRVQQLAKSAGGKMTERYGHLLIQASGVKQPRHARIVETKLKGIKGVLMAAVAGTGAIQIEFDQKEINQETVLKEITNSGLLIQNFEDFHVHKKKEEHNHEGHEHEHRHGGIFGEKTELIFSIICGGLLGIGFGLSFIDAIPAAIPLSFYIGAYFFGGFFTAKEAIQTIVRGGFEIDFLMLVAAIGAAILGEWAEGALLLFLFSLGHALEHFAMEKARKSITALAGLAPKTALLKTGNALKEVPITELKEADVIVVKPNTKIAADGIVINGNGSVNQAPITGESIPVDKVPVEDAGISIAEANKLAAKYRVFAGTINGNGSLEIKVTRMAADSTISRIVKMVNEAQTQKSPTQRFTDKFEKYFVPAVLILVVLLCFSFVIIDEPFSKSFYRAMSVLVAASPCALAISTPSAVLSGVARGARGGVLIKGGKPLEDLGSLTAIAFDKTGTLTEGSPKLAQIIPGAGMNEDELLKIAVAVEALSDHPIAKAIVKNGKEKLKGQDIPQAKDLEAVLGKGIKATLGNDTIYIGNLALFEKLDNNKPGSQIINDVKNLEASGSTTMMVRRNNDYIGILSVMDTPRQEAKNTLDQLKQLGIRRMIMLSGDNQQVAEAIAKQTGITDAWGGLLPEQKVEAIKKLKQEEGKVAMVGDGVNDAPAMGKQHRRNCDGSGRQRCSIGNC